MTWLDYWKTICCFWVLFLCFVWMDKSYVQPLSEALPFSVLMMQCELVGFLFWLLRTAIICILVWVLGAVTSKCFGVFFPWPWMVSSYAWADHSSTWSILIYTPGWLSVLLWSCCIPLCSLELSPVNSCHFGLRLSALSLQLRESAELCFVYSCFLLSSGKS